MGAKLSKKKKGYCLGAGKDGESTETTEVEQKEMENQDGQKDAAEPNGEKSPTDQSQNNGISEESKDKEAEVTTGETTKDQSNQDQKPEIKPSTEQEKGEEKDQPQGTKEQDEVKSAAPEQACEKELKRASEDKTKTECDVKETPSSAADKPTQESKPVKEEEGSDCKPSSETKQLAPVPDEVWVKQVSEPVTKVEAEQTEKPPAPVGSEDQVSEKVPAQANEPVVEPEKLEKVPEKVEPSTPKSVSIEPVAEPVSETVVSEPVSKTEVVEPEVVEPIQVSEVVKPQETAVPEKVDSALPNSDPTTEPTHSALPEPVEPATKEPELAPEPEPSAVPEPVALPASVPEILIEMAVSEQNDEPEPVPCPASEKICETKQEQELTSEPLPPKSTEVPDKTANASEPTENQESLGCSDQSAEAATIPLTTEASSINPPPDNSEKPAASEAPVLLQNGPSENLAEDDHIEVPPISTELKVEDNEEQKEVVEEEVGLDKPATPQESQVVNEDCKAPIDGLVTLKDENDSTAPPDTKETHDASPHCNSEDKAENRDISAEETKNDKEPPAPEILEKYGVGNGLPIKEEIKVHLEDKCDNDLHDINGQSESHAIQVCNE